jgi:hypothetical protein
MLMLLIMMKVKRRPPMMARGMSQRTWVVKTGGAEEGEEEEGDDDEDAGGEEGDAAGGVLLGLEFAFVADEVLIGDGDMFGDLSLQFEDEGLEVPLGGVDADDKSAGGIFSLNDVGTAGFPDIGDEAKGDALAGGGVDVHVAEAIGGFTPFFREAEDEVDGALAFVEFADDFAADEGGELSIEFAGSDAISEGALAVDFDAELRDGGLLFGQNLIDFGINHFDLAAEVKQFAHLLLVWIFCHVILPSLGEIVAHTADGVGMYPVGDLDAA